MSERPTLYMRRFRTTNPKFARASDPTHDEAVCAKTCGYKKFGTHDDWTEFPGERLPYPVASEERGGSVNYDRSVTGAMEGFSEAETAALLGRFLVRGSLSDDREALRLLLRVADMDDETLALLMDRGEK